MLLTQLVSQGLRSPMWATSMLASVVRWPWTLLFCSFPYLSFFLFCNFAVFLFVICLFLGFILFITLFLLLRRFTPVAPASFVLFLFFAVSNLLINRPGSLRLDLRQAGGGHRRHHQGLYHPPYRGTHQVTITLQHPTLSENRKYHMVIVLFAGIFCRISSMGWCLLPRWLWLKKK